MDDKLLTQFYRLLLRLYPQEHRNAFGEEMVGVFAQSLSAARAEGLVTVVALMLRELLCLPSNLAQAYAESWREWRPALAGMPGWRWMVAWAGGTSGAIPLSLLLMAPLAGLLLLLLRISGVRTAANSDVLRGLGFLLALSLTVATVQWFLLRRYLPRAGLWLIATVLGWLAAGALVASGSVLVSWLSNSLATAEPLWILMIVLPLFSLATAVPQMWLLRRLSGQAGWWLVFNLMAFSSILLAGRAIESVLELGAILVLPGIISAGGLFWLLRQAPVGDGGVETIEKRRWLRRPGIVALLLVSLVALCLLAPWAYTVGQLELARNEGVYASVEEAVIARSRAGWGGANVVSVENVYAGPNSSREGTEHVWFGGATVRLDRIPQGGRRDTYLSGSFYLRVRDGWVHVPEGAFPEIIGQLMTLYNIESAGSD